MTDPGDDWIPVVFCSEVGESPVTCHGCDVGLLLTDDDRFILVTEPDAVFLCPECGVSLREFASAEDLVETSEIIAVEGGGDSP